MALGATSCDTPVQRGCPIIAVNSTIAGSYAMPAVSRFGATNR
jgi:hypothetical protein